MTNTVNTLARQFDTTRPLSLDSTRQGPCLLIALGQVVPVFAILRGCEKLLNTGENPSNPARVIFLPFTNYRQLHVHPFLSRKQNKSFGNLQEITNCSTTNSPLLSTYAGTDRGQENSLRLTYRPFCCASSWAARCGKRLKEEGNNSRQRTLSLILVQEARAFSETQALDAVTLVVLVVFASVCLFKIF